MIREIKFRGLDLMSGNWVHGSHLKTGMGLEFIVPQNVIANQLPQYAVDKETVGQYTGLKDKNSIEIYAGDIVKQEYSVIFNTSYDPDSYGFIEQEDEEGYHIGEIVITASKGVTMRNPIRYVEDEEPQKSNQYKSVSGYRCEVIGSIYENPKLLEVDDS